MCCALVVVSKSAGTVSVDVDVMLGVWFNVAKNVVDCPVFSKAGCLGKVRW